MRLDLTDTDDPATRQRLVVLALTLCVFVSELRFRRLRSDVTRALRARVPTCPVPPPAIEPLVAGPPSDASGSVSGRSHDRNPENGDAENETGGDDGDANRAPLGGDCRANDATQKWNADEDGTELPDRQVHHSTSAMNSAIWTTDPGAGAGHGADRAVRTTTSAERANYKRRVALALRLLWTVLFIVSVLTAASVSSAPGKHGAPPSAAPDIIAGFNILLGTLIGFAQIPNREAMFADDSDLAAMSVAFLAVGALLPLAPSFRTHTLISEITAGLILLCIAPYLFWNWWTSRSDDLD